jgi:hypothetical protein
MKVSEADKDQILKTSKASWTPTLRTLWTQRPCNSNLRILKAHTATKNLKRVSIDCPMDLEDPSHPRQCPTHSLWRILDHSSLLPLFQSTNKRVVVIESRWCVIWYRSPRTYSVPSDSTSRLRENLVISTWGRSGHWSSNSRDSGIASWPWVTT